MLFHSYVALHRRILKSVSLGRELKTFPAPYMTGIENPGEFPNITRGLVKRGYSEAGIQKVVGGNALRIVEEVVG